MARGCSLNQFEGLKYIYIYIYIYMFPSILVQDSEFESMVKIF